MAFGGEACLIGPMRHARPMTEAERPALLEWLSRDPVVNVFPLGTLEEHGIGGIEEAHEFHGGPAGGPLRAALLVAHGGLWMPCGDPTELAAIATALPDVPLASAIGAPAAVGALWTARGGGRAPRLSRTQRLMRMTADHMGPWIAPQLRRAVEADLPALVTASALMQREDLGFDPRDRDAAGHERHCRERVNAGRSFVLYEGAHLAFKADVGPRSRFGVQIEGVYTAPGFRRQGVATRGLGQLCRLLLASLPRVTLHADAQNRAALDLYRKLGFATERDLQLLIAA